MQMNHYSIDSFAKYEDAYKASTEHPEKFWEGIAHEFVWQKPWNKTLEWEFNTPNVKWFQGGVLNITENCIDRHLTERGEDTALSGNQMILMSRKFDLLSKNYMSRYVALRMYSSPKG